MANMSSKFNEAPDGLVSIVFTSLFPCMCIVTLTFLPLPSKINRVHPLANMYAKFDGEAHNGKVSILFKSLFPYMSIVTSDLQNQ